LCPVRAGVRHLMRDDQVMATATCTL
jgi:hypothetical protein